MDLQNKAKVDKILKDSLDKFDKLDKLCTDALEGVDPSNIRATALAQLLQVRLQYMQYFSQEKKDGALESGSNDVLEILQKTTPELREEFLDVWQRILQDVADKEAGEIDGEKS